MENQHQNLFDLQVDHEVSGYLAETAKWAKLLAIVGFVMTGIMVIFSFFAGSIMTYYASTMGGGASGMASGFLTVIYLLFALLVFFPYLYLYNFAKKMQTALKASSQEDLAKSFSNLKSCFKYVGILTLIVLGFYALIFVFALLGGIFAATM